MVDPRWGNINPWGDSLLFERLIAENCMKMKKLLPRWLMSQAPLNPPVIPKFYSLASWHLNFWCEGMFFNTYLCAYVTHARMIHSSRMCLKYLQFYPKQSCHAVQYTNYSKILESFTRNHEPPMWHCSVVIYLVFGWSVAGGGEHSIMVITHNIWCNTTEKYGIL